ncbi:unnamed protein product [Closterium sp. NIES-53]
MPVTVGSSGWQRLQQHARCCIISHVAASAGARPPLAISDDMALLQRLAYDATALVARLPLLLTPTTVVTAAPVAHGSTCCTRQLRNRPHTAVTPGVWLSPSCRGENA